MRSPILISVLVLTITGAALSEHAYWGYTLSTPLLIAANRDFEATGLLAIAFVQTFSWPFWIATAIVFSTSIDDFPASGKHEQAQDTRQEIEPRQVSWTEEDQHRIPLLNELVQLQMKP